MPFTVGLSEGGRFVLQSDALNLQSDALCRSIASETRSSTPMTGAYSARKAVVVLLDWVSKRLWAFVGPHPAVSGSGTGTPPRLLLRPPPKVTVIMRPETKRNRKRKDTYVTSP